MAKEENIIYWLLNPDNPQISQGTLKDFGLEKIYREIELPLSRVLADMRERGIVLDSAYLKNLRQELIKKTSKLVNGIYKEAGGEFNVNSPKQLLNILFEKLKIEPRLKSTAADQLQLIQNQHPIVKLVLDYRESFKLLSTYVEPLLELGDVVRTTLLQTGTATGRLSSQNPNLQDRKSVV